MRRIVFSLACLLIGINAMAQLPMKITAKFAKGSQATYLFDSETSIGSPMGDSPIKSTSSSEVKFSVTEVRPNGYTIEATMLNVDGNNLNLPGEEAATKLVVDFLKQWVGKKALLQADKDGKILSIKNYEALKAELSKVAEDLIKTVPAEGAEGSALTSELLQKTLVKQLDEDKMISTFTGKVFDFYGKTISTGMMEDIEVEGMKAKDTYVISAPKNSSVYTINSTTVVAMSNDDLKAMLLKQLEDNMPEDQVEALKPQIDQMINGGMIKIDGKGTATYVFKKNSWMQSMDSSMTLDVMGNKTEITSKATLKESK